MLVEHLDDRDLAEQIIASVSVCAMYSKVSVEEMQNGNRTNSSICAVTSSDVKSFLTPVILSKRWGITLDSAKATM
jgi:hypothetical protein